MIGENGHTGSMGDVLDAKIIEIREYAQEIDQCRVLRGRGFLLVKKNLSEEAFRIFVEERMGFTMDEARDDMRFAEEIARRSEN